MFSTLEEAWSNDLKFHSNSTIEPFGNTTEQSTPHHNLMCERKLSEILQCKTCRSKLQSILSENYTQTPIVPKLNSLIEKFYVSDNAIENIIFYLSIVVLLLILLDK